MRRMSNYALYVGGGVWWQLSQRAWDSGKFKDLLVRYRKPAKRYV